MTASNVHNHALGRVAEARGALRPAGARIGAVSYLNTLPLIEGLEKLRDVSLTLAPPAALCDLLLDGRVDLALAPVIEAARSPEALAVAPVGAIGSAGETLTVRLFSRSPIDRLTCVHADVESRTSVALLRLLLREMHDVDVAIEPFRAREDDWPDAVLLIGDKVETSAPSAVSHPHRLDLGHAWRELTGQPFVYALWVCRAADARSEAVRLGATALDRQRRRNAMRLGWIASARGPERGWSIAAARSYVTEHLRFDAGEEERVVVERFLARCCEQGLAPKTPHPLRWLAPEDWRLPPSPCLR